MESGIGHEALNKFMSIINMPPVYRKTMVRAQTRVGISLSNVAKESCKEAIQEERRLTIERTQRWVISVTSSVDIAMLLHCIDECSLILSLCTSVSLLAQGALVPSCEHAVVMVQTLFFSIFQLPQKAIFL